VLVSIIEHRRLGAPTAFSILFQKWALPTAAGAIHIAPSTDPHRGFGRPYSSGSQVGCNEITLDPPLGFRPLGALN
jgi:hypothetical protein